MYGSNAKSSRLEEAEKVPLGLVRWRIDRISCVWDLGVRRDRERERVWLELRDINRGVGLWNGQMKIAYNHDSFMFL